MDLRDLRDPKDLRDLLSLCTSMVAEPHYKHHTVENYGIFSSNGQFQIKGGLTYLEHGTSDFENLQMSGGDVNIAPPPALPLPAQMNVRGSLTGTIKDFVVEGGSHFTGHTLSFNPLQNFHCGTGATFHSPNPFRLDIAKKYTNTGILSSNHSIDLQVSEDTEDLGMVIAKEKIRLLHKKQSLLQNRILAAAQQEKHCRARFITKKTITYCDHYLNTITSHQELDSYGHVIRSWTTETGYLFQRRTEDVKESSASVTSEVLGVLRQQDARLQSIHADLEDLVAQQTNLQKEIAQKTREYNRELLRALMRAGGKPGDIHRLTHDPLLRLLDRWDDVPEEKQELIAQEQPFIADLAEITSDGKQHLSPFMQFCDDHARTACNFLVAAAAAFIFRNSAPLQFALATEGTTVVARLAPPFWQAIGRADALQRLTTFFHKAKDSRDNGKNERLVNTPEEREKFISDKISAGILKKEKVIDNRQSYRFIKKDGKFKKGDWFTNDKRHNELEWFNERGDHKGAIEPKTGTKYKPADPSRKLNVQ
ncbi:hypothetical protein AGMMS49949_05180 [Alphaproteobacteria bacterium]|nr:hypothetical protein AGMMS49949_05180 [Alphaproteobacteria bacterium]